MLFVEIIRWCEMPHNNFAYEIGKEWCDCVDYSDYMNIYLKGGYRATIYYHTNTDSYSCRLYEKKSTIAIVENITGVFDLIDVLGEYGLL